MFLGSIRQSLVISNYFWVSGEIPNLVVTDIFPFVCCPSDEAQRKLNELQAKKEGGQKFILSPEQQAEIKRFKDREAEAKKKLKTVRKELRQDIDSLENRLKWTNIAAPMITMISRLEIITTSIRPSTVSMMVVSLNSFMAKTRWYSSIMN